MKGEPYFIFSHQTIYDDGAIQDAVTSSKHRSFADSNPGPIIQYIGLARVTGEPYQLY